MHVYVWSHTLLIPKIQQTAPHKIINYQRSKLNFGGLVLAAKLPLPDLQDICMYELVNKLVTQLVMLVGLKKLHNSFMINIKHSTIASPLVKMNCVF